MRMVAEQVEIIGKKLDGAYILVVEHGAVQSEVTVRSSNWPAVDKNVVVVSGENVVQEQTVDAVVELFLSAPLAVEMIKV